MDSGRPTSTDLPVRLSGVIACMFSTMSMK